MKIRWEQTVYNGGGNVTHKDNGTFSLSEAYAFFWEQCRMFADKQTGEGVSVVDAGPGLLEVEVVHGQRRTNYVLNWLPGSASGLLESIRHLVLRQPKKHGASAVRFFVLMYS